MTAHAAGERDAGWRTARRVLCIRPDNLGDVLMTTPALRALKHAAPQRQLTLLTSASGAAAAAYVPEVDAVIEHALPWVASPRYGEPVDELRLIRRLRAQRFDAAVIFTVYSQSALPAAWLCRMASIPLRLGHCRENPYALLTDWRPETEPQSGVRHEVRRQLDLVASVGATTRDERLSFTVPEAAHRRVVRRLSQLGIDRPCVLIHPGATAASRRYPPVLFADAASRIGRQLDCTIVFNGTADERELVESIRAGMSVPSLSLAGELSLAESAALIELSRVLVGNNSGPVHLAAAIGTPVVDLYALTNPQHEPWQVPHRLLFHDVPCRHCYKSICPQAHHDCLSKVDPRRVARETLELIAETGGIRRAATDRPIRPPVQPEVYA